MEWGSQSLAVAFLKITKILLSISFFWHRCVSHPFLGEFMAPFVLGDLKSVHCVLFYMAKPHTSLISYYS